MKKSSIFLIGILIFLFLNISEVQAANRDLLGTETAIISVAVLAIIAIFLIALYTYRRL